MESEQSKHYNDYTLTDIIGLARENVITYMECAEIMEEQIPLRYPKINGDYNQIFEFVKGWCVSDQGHDFQRYCHRLAELERTLQKINSR